MEHKEIHRYTFTYKDIQCEIVFWTNEMMREEYKETNEGIWTSYFYLKKEKNKELFDKFSLKGYWNERFKNYFMYDYQKLDISMHGGVTFYEYIRGGDGEIKAIKIGNDYNHYGDGIYDENYIKKDLERTIDGILQVLNNN